MKIEIRYIKKNLLIFGLVSLLLLVEFIYFYPLLPQKMASHFSFSNHPSNWIPKSSFVILFVWMYLLITIFVIGFAVLLPRIPDNFINIPNREFLLQPARKDKTLSYISNYLVSIGSLTILLFVVIDYFIFRANIDKSHKLPPVFFPVVILYTLIIVLMSIAMYRKLKNAPIDKTSGS